MMMLRFVFCLLAGLALVGSAYAQGAPALDEEGVHMIQAVQKAMTGDYPGAEREYSAVLSVNPSNIDAYLQRGVLRRELKNMPGAQADAKIAAGLINDTLRQNPRDANAYHQRSTAARLLGNYPQATQDIQTALTLGGDPDWRNDLRDTALEEKASHGIR